MLRAIRNVRQIPGEPPRRWFSSDRLDLVVWNDDSGAPLGFQFCYDKGGAERALRWDAASGFRFLGIDDGEGEGGLRYKASPILIADGAPDLQYMSEQFYGNSAQLPPDVLALVGGKLDEYCKQKDGQ